MNKVIGVGNVGGDVKFNEASETHVARFSIACNDRRNKDAKPEWLNCVAFGKLADVIHQYVKQGHKLYVEGRMSTREYEGKYYTDIIVNDVEFLTTKAEAERIDATNGPSTDVPY
jgi:single-strand DNA-binding protein